MIKTLDVAIAVAITFLILFVWIVIMLKKISGVPSSPSDLPESLLQTIQEYKNLCRVGGPEGKGKIKRRKFAKMVYRGIMSGEIVF